MLPAANRMRRPADFTSTVRGGVRSRPPHLVVHHLSCAEVGTSAPALVGLVVGRSVGPSVVRNRVSRRLRAQLAARLDRLPVGTRTVVRALPGSAGDESAALGQALDQALERILGGRR